MTRTSLCQLALALTLLLPHGLAAQDGKPDDPTEGLSIAERFELLRDLSATKKADGNPILSSSYRSSFLRYLSQSERFFSQEDFPNAVTQLNSTLSYASKADVLNNEVLKLQKALDKEAKGFLDARLAKTEAFIEEARKICLTAKDEDSYEDLLDGIEAEQAFLNRYSSSTYPQTRRARERIGRARNFITIWMRVVTAEADGDYGAALRHMSSATSSSYRFLKHSQLEAKRKQLTTDMNKGMEAALGAMRTELEKAKTAEAVQTVSDDFMVLYQKVQQSGSSNPYYQKLQYAQQAIQYWMNVVVAEEEGNFQQALNHLRSLEGSTYYRNTAVLSAKAIAARKAALTENLLHLPAKPNPAVAKIGERIQAATSAAELVKIAAGIQGLTSVGVSLPTTLQQEVFQLNADLQQLQREQGFLRTRRYAQLFQGSTSSSGTAHRWADTVGRFRLELWTKAIAAMCQLNETQAKGEDEALDAWVLRLTDAAVKAGDWKQAHRYLDAYRVAFFGHGAQPGWLQAELAGIHAYIVGTNLEAAGEVHKATSKYLAVLEQVGTRVPTAAASARLKALKETPQQ